MQFARTHVTDSLKQMPMSRAARSCDKHMLNFVNISRVWSQCLSFSTRTSKAWELYLPRSLNEVSYFQWKSLLAILRRSYLDVVWIPAFLGTSGITCPLLCLFVKCPNKLWSRQNLLWRIHSNVFPFVCFVCLLLSFESFRNMHLFYHIGGLQFCSRCRRYFQSFGHVFVRTRTCWNLTCQVLLVNSVFAIMFSNS